MTDKNNTQDNINTPGASKKGESAKVKAKKATKKHTKIEREPREVTGFVRAVPVILFALALFVTLCFITGETGAFGSFISGFFKGLFSYMAYTIPAFLLMHAICFYSDYTSRRMASRVIFSVITLITLSMVAFIISDMNSDIAFNAKEFYNNGKVGIGGGFIGSLIAFGLAKLVGNIGLLIIIALVFAIYVIFFFSGKSGSIGKYMLKKIAAAANYGAKLEKRGEEKKKKREEEKRAKRIAADEKKNSKFYDDEFFYTDNGVSKLEIPELGIIETKDRSAGYVLRETVIQHTPEEETKKNDTVEERSFSNGYEEIIFERADDTEGKFRDDDIILEEVEAPVQKNEEPKKTARDFGIDDSADAIFTADFDPYDIALNQKRAERMSSKAETEAKEPAGYSEYIADMTPEQMERLRRMKEFEASRDAALRRKEQAEAERRAAEEAAREEAEIKNAQMAEAARIAEENRLAEEARIKEEERLAQEARIREAERIAEEERQRSAEQAAALAREEEARSQNYQSQPSGYDSVPRVVSVNNITNAYDREYGNVNRRAQSSDGYRFVRETIREERLPYSNPTSDVRIDYNRNAEPAKPTYESVKYTASASYDNQRVAPAPTESISYEDEAPRATAPAYTEEQAVQTVPSYNIPDAAPATETSQYAPTQIIEPAPTVQEVSVSTYDAPAAPVFEEVAIFEEPNEKSYAKETETVETTFSFEGSDDTDEEEVSAEAQAATIEITRTPLESEIKTEVRAGLDFTDDDEEEDSFSEEDAENAEPPVEIPIEEQNPKISEYQGMFDIFTPKATDEDAAADGEDENSTEESFEDELSEDTGIAFSDEEDVPDDDEDADDEPPFDAPEPEPVPEKKAPKPDYANYKFPPIDLLRKIEVDNTAEINEELQEGAEQLISTLNSFNIAATVRSMDRGPRITRYSIVPAKGTRVNQIERLSDDIALAMAAESIRIEAPIPGKSAVGIEVPNKVPSIVSLRDLLESDEFMNDPSKTMVCIGKSVEGMLVFGDIATMPHLLIAGATGMGKSVCMNSLITSILYKARPDEVKFIMIDPKKVEFAPYNGIPHLLVPVVTDPKQAAGTLMWAVDEMNKRYDIIEKLCVRGIDSYNEKVALDPTLGAPMAKIVIFIDELNDLMIQVRDPVENLIMLIAQKARAAGIHLVIGTQRPSVNVITGVIKANIPSRIACKVSSGIDSRTILEQTGAEKLIGKGDMLFAPGGKPNPKRVQGAFVSESETAAIVEFVKKQAKGEIYDEQAMEDMRRAAQKCDKSKNEGSDDFDDDEESSTGFLHDRKFLGAVELAIRNGSVATSFLQRKLHIGYGKAAQYIDIMEDLGVVGEKNGSKARDILITMGEWQEKLSRLTLDDEY